jgi:hypothetical protein
MRASREDSIQVLKKEKEKIMRVSTLDLGVSSGRGRAIGGGETGMGGGGRQECSCDSIPGLVF